MPYLEIPDRAVAVAMKMLIEHRGRFSPSFVRSVIEAALARAEIKIEPQIDEQLTILIGDAFGDVEKLAVKLDGPAIETMSNTIATVAVSSRPA